MSYPSLQLCTISASEGHECRFHPVCQNPRLIQAHRIGPRTLLRAMVGSGDATTPSLRDYALHETAHPRTPIACKATNELREKLRPGGDYFPWNKNHPGCSQDASRDPLAQSRCETMRRAPAGEHSSTISPIVMTPTVLAGMGGHEEYCGNKESESGGGDTALLVEDNDINMKVSLALFALYLFLTNYDTKPPLTAAHRSYDKAANTLPMRF